MRRKNAFFTILVVATLSLGACSKQEFVLQSMDGSKIEDDMSDFFVSGIGQKDKIDVASICGGPEKVMRVETELTFMNGLLGVLSGGLYTPRQYRVFCRI